MDGLLAKFLRALTQGFYPTECPFCDEPSGGSRTSPVCDSCFSSIEVAVGQVCKRCSKPLHAEDATHCLDCMSAPPRFLGSRCVGPYEDPLKEAIHRLKFGGMKRMARPLGKLLIGLDLPEADLLVPVPVGLKGLRARGFNQSFLLAKEISRSTGLFVDNRTLYKQKETPPQVGLPGAMRRINLRGAFAMRAKLNGERVLLVDDVITTGATMNECTKTLLKGGASEVVAVALART